MHSAIVICLIFIFVRVYVWPKCRKNDEDDRPVIYLDVSVSCIISHTLQQAFHVGPGCFAVLVGGLRLRDSVPPTHVNYCACPIYQNART